MWVLPSRPSQGYTWVLQPFPLGPTCAFPKTEPERSLYSTWLVPEVGEEDEISVNSIPLWSHCLTQASGGRKLGHSLLDVGQALLLCLEAGMVADSLPSASGGRRRIHRWLVGAPGAWHRGWEFLAGAGALPPRLPVCSAGGQPAGERKKHIAHTPARAAPEPRAFPVLAPESCTGRPERWSPG